MNSKSNQKPPFRDTVSERYAVRRGQDALTGFEADTDQDLLAWTGKFSVAINELLAVVANLQAVADHTEGVITTHECGTAFVNPAKEIRTAATKLRDGRTYRDLTEPLAVWLESAAEDSEVIGTDFRALAVARAINGSAR